MKLHGLRRNFRKYSTQKSSNIVPSLPKNTNKLINVVILGNTILTQY